MIASLAGLLDSTGEGWAVVDVGGVGYLVECSARTQDNLPAPGEPVRLAVETIVRQEFIRLYGFTDPAERDWFRLLGSVQGVGARMALALLSTLSPDELAGAISTDEQQQLTRAPGVGPKLARRIITELREKIPGTATTTGAPAARLPDAARDAISALVNLGYPDSRAAAAVAAVRGGVDAGDASGLIRAALRELAR